MLFEHLSKSDSNELALADGAKQLTWGELEASILSYAYLFRDGFKLVPENHVALLMGNRAEFIESILGAFVAGLWVTPVNTHLTPHEINYIIEDSGAQLIVTDHECQALLGGRCETRTINVDELSGGYAGQESKTMKAFNANSPVGGTMLYTSGTTGRPKGVKRAKPDSIEAAISSYVRFADSVGLDGQGTHLVTGPLYHAAPMLFAIYDLFNGAGVLIMDKWDTRQFIELVSEHQVTHTHLVPTMMVRLLELIESGVVQREQIQHQLASLKLLLHGAAPVSVSVKRRMIDLLGPILVEYWGGTEAGTTTLVDSEQWLERPGTVGRPLAQYQVYVGNEKGEPVAETEGMLYCRHSNLKQVFEYHNDQAKTAAAHPQPYVFSIGDIGRVDEDGYVYLMDRRSNLIISGGVNIYPAEIEQALLSHKGVLDAVVFGVPDPEWGARVLALVEAKAGVDLSEGMLVSFLQSTLAKFKIPRRIHIVDRIPRMPTGKVRLQELRERYGDGTAIHT